MIMAKTYNLYESMDVKKLKKQIRAKIEKDIFNLNIRIPNFQKDILMKDFFTDFEYSLKYCRFTVELANKK